MSVHKLLLENEVAQVFKTFRHDSQNVIRRDSIRQTSNQLEPKTVAPVLKTAEVTRHEEGGLIVAIDRPGYHAYRTASGANLARVLSRLDSNLDLLLITSFLGVKTKFENEESFRKIPNELRVKLKNPHLAGYWLVGHWTECSMDPGKFPTRECDSLGGELTHKLEYSWLFSRTDKTISQEDWLAAGVEIAIKYEQDGFIVRLSGETTVRSCTGSVYNNLSSDQTITNAWAVLGKLRSYGEPFGRSELKNFPERGRIQSMVVNHASKSSSEAKTSSYEVTGEQGAFAADFFQAVPHNISGNMLFHAMGARSFPPK